MWLAKTGRQVKGRAAIRRSDRDIASHRKPAQGIEIQLIATVGQAVTKDKDAPVVAWRTSLHGFP